MNKYQNAPSHVFVFKAGSWSGFREMFEVHRTDLAMFATLIVPSPLSIVNKPKFINVQ